MEAYTDFATVYDTFMDETPYDTWCDNIEKWFKTYHVPKGLILDLGCGTGNITKRLAARGYDMIGVDISASMLEIAGKKNENKDYDILYLLQDMRSFELYGTVGAVVSICDSINYLLTEEDLVSTFSLVNNYLDPGGIFIFDFNTVYKYRDIIGDMTIAENREECSFIWENYYHEEEEINEYDLTIFIKNSEGAFQRFQENHFQRGYNLEVIKEALSTAGMSFVEAVDALTMKEVTSESERIYCIARERGKEQCQII